MTRLDRLCLQDNDNSDNNHGLWDKIEHEQRAELFEWVREVKNTI